MLQRWKLIISNWINCYFNKTSKEAQNHNTESLLYIISHLRENLNLDESKSSILEAHTVEEFICEKYPEFKFNNGTVEAANDEEICLSASLLLFFVCVNSKNLDLKTAMCSKLSSEDQETILKFSKYLMKCSVITVAEVETAITAACGQDAMELPRQFSVVETPPVLRSLHSEVRRLQAALDAERFDRNYLQEELSRTNTRLEHLLKEKEQHKLDISNLKAKISLCCGEEADAKNSEKPSDKSSKLRRQLQQLEERLDQTQTQLLDVTYERDTHKAKIDELKRERDEWLSLSQLENIRVSQLSEELDTERCHIQSLKELVGELRQHNRLNGLDTSSLECDDPDSSVHSLQHNSSSCSEVCANVVEVQLGEERAKIVVMSQQIQALQDQINELNQNRETDKKTLENIIAQRENDNFNLKHRINEDIEKMNSLKAHCDNEMTKLNNEINELEQRLKNNNEHSRSIIEKKMLEIQTIQEEKLSLLHSLNSETTKLQNVIKDLKSELDSERQSRSSMKEGYENHIMKLNEKVLNRNNELVELQNTNFEKGEKIEILQMELRKEKEIFNELKSKHQNLNEQKNTIENDLRQKYNEVHDLHKKVQHNSTVIDDMNTEIQHLKTLISSLSENCKTLEGVKEQLLDEIRKRDSKIEETLKDTEHVKEVFKKEKDKLLQDMDERNATVNSLQIQLQNEIEYKVQLQNELTQLQIAKNTLAEESQVINSELSTLKIEMADKNKTIVAMDLYIQEEKKLTDKANEKIRKITDDIIVKENDIKMMNDKLNTTTKCLQDEIQNNKHNDEVSCNKLLTEIEEKKKLQAQLNTILSNKSHLQKDILLKCEEVLKLQKECEELSQKLVEDQSHIQFLEQKCSDYCINISDITEIIKTTVGKIQNATTDSIKTMEFKIEEKERHFNKICNKLEIIKNVYEVTTNTLHKTQNEIEILNSKLNDEISIKSKLEEDCHDQKMQFENLTTQLKGEIESKNTEINSLKADIQSLLKNVDGKTECIKSLEESLQQENQTKNEIACQKEREIKDLQSEIAELQSITEDMEQKFCKEIEIKKEAMQALEKENEQLLLTIEENKRNHEQNNKEKDTIVHKFEEQVKNNIVKFEDLTQYTEELKTSWENYKAETKAAIKEKEDKIAQLNEMALTFEQKINEIEQEKWELTKHIIEIEDSKVLLAQNKNQLADIAILTQDLKEERSVKIILENEKSILLSEKQDLLQEKVMLAQELSEERSVRNIAEEEKNILLSDKIEIKQKLYEEIEKANVLLQEKYCLTQQLIEEKSAKNIAEKEKELLVAEKELLEERSIENEKNKATLCQEIITLKQQIKVLQQDLKKEKETLLILNKENSNISEELVKQQSFTQNLFEEKQSLVSENDELKKDLLNANSTYEIMEVEKESLEMALHIEKSTRDEMENEKNNVALKLQLELINKDEENQNLIEEYERLKETFDEYKNQHMAIINEKESLLLDMKLAQEEVEAKKASLDSALIAEKSICNEVQSEKDVLAKKLELEMTNKEKEKKILKDEIEKLKMALVAQKVEQDTQLESELTNMGEERKALLDVIEKLKATLFEQKAELDKQLELELANKEQETILLSKIENLEALLVEQKAEYCTLVNERDFYVLEKESLVSEKESLVKSLSNEKCVRDEIETEKNGLKMKIEELNKNLNQYERLCNENVSNLAITDKETKLFQTALKQLETDHRYLQEANAKITTAFNDSLDKLVQKFNKKNISSEIIQKFVNDKNFKEMPLEVAFDLIFKIAEALISEISLLKDLEVSLRSENEALSVMQDNFKQKENQVFELQTEIERLEQVVNESKIDQSKQSETYITSMNSKIKDIQALQQENQTLHNDLNNVRLQLEVKVHSLKEKLTDSENLTDKLKRNYECQIDNLNVMITKLTNYLKEKTVELESLRKEKDMLHQTIGDSCKVIKTLEDDIKTEKLCIDKLKSDFESERQDLNNKITETESIIEETKLSLNNMITELLLAKECFEVEKNELKALLHNFEMKYCAQEMAFTSLLQLLRLERKGKEDVEKESEIVRDFLDEVISHVNKERNANISVISALEFQEKVLAADHEKLKNDLDALKLANRELTLASCTIKQELNAHVEQLNAELIEKSELKNELQTQADMLTKVLEEKSLLETALQEKTQYLTVAQLEVKELKTQVIGLFNDKTDLELEKRENNAKMEAFKSKVDSNKLEEKELTKLRSENQQLLSTIEANRSMISNLEQLIKREMEENHKLRDDNEHEKILMANKCSLLKDQQSKVEKELEQRVTEIVTLKNEIETLQCKVELNQQDSKAKDGLISKMSKEKDAVISRMSKELIEEKAIRENYEKELQTQMSIVNELKKNMEIRALKTENEQLIRAMGQQETFTALCQEKTAEKYSCQPESRFHPQVDNSSSDNTHSSIESLKTITDLEKIIHDKNRTITTLQIDITYLKSLMAESETKLLDVNKELEVNKEHCEQLSGQLKKIVYQKNEEIAEIKKHLHKMSATENRASQIIKVSAKYQAMILKRIAEIKSNTILKELTNFGNSNNCDNELRRSLNAGSITMEDLENFLETTDRHLKRCSEKQIVLQKDRDRLYEVNKINESEIINLKKFLTELSVSFQTFSSLKDLYGHKLSRVISVQRTVRREILNLDGRITDAAMCKLERGYGAAMQDLSECTMNLERWVERCISRTVSVEKIKQAFTSDSERSSLASPSFQNTGLEIQLEELEKSFQKLLEEVARAVKGDAAKESQASTVMEVRAEYEDKLNRMKAKMKDLFNDQMAVLKNKQREEIGLLERELQKTRTRMEDSKRAYENHIRELTKELWSVGEKYLVKNDEAEWLRKKQRSGSLMSLQHVHSSGLVSAQEPASRPSDAHSLRSLPVTDNTKTKREGRGLHMSDEEGEVFDNRWLKELSATPRREPPPGQRLSELKWRNSLCPPHLKSSYPAETQFAPVLDEEEIKVGAAGPASGRSQRKEVGITAYKKPGPPTPSKQAGRLSATDSELRESLRVDSDPHAPTERKISTPARFRAFLRFNKNDTNEGTPRARRLSNIFRKK